MTVVKSRRPFTNIVFASANVADPTFGSFCVVRPAAVGELASSALYDGVEWHPTFDLTVATARAVAKAVRKNQLNLNSLHASFREVGHSHGTNSAESAKKRGLAERAMASPVGRLVMPGVVESSAFMNSVQNRVDARLPVVFYPQLDYDLDTRARTEAKAGKKLFQPTDHVAGLLGARNAEELVEMTIGSGAYDGFVLDTFHMQRRYGKDDPGVVSDLDRSLPFLLPYAEAGHLSLNRTDCIAGEPHLSGTTRDDLCDALDGRYYGATAEILEGLRDKGVDYVAVEAPARQVSEATGHVLPVSLTVDYRSIATGLRSFFAPPGPHSLNF